MNITFFIGNGFDLNLGLKTGYRDFLNAYIKEGHSNALTDSIKKDIETWADLERQLGIYAGTISPEKADEFFNNIDELESSLTQYLKEVSSSKLIVEQNGGNEFKERITGFVRYLPIREQEHFKVIIAKVCETIYYSFIDFNYTEYIDQIYAEAKNVKPFGTHIGGSTNYHDEIRMPLHIHGYLDDELILGVNDETQIGETNATPLPVIVEYMSKPSINDKLGNQKIKQAKTIIDKSLYICVYGMSLGITDKSWWSYIGEWLKGSTDRRLILFMHGDPSHFNLGSRIARKQDEVRRRFLTTIEMQDQYESLAQQIIVQFNSSIFDFDSIKLEA